jgi:tetratricopeptide (TPR) repeat protein
MGGSDIAAARAALLADRGRLREALEVLEPLVQAPTGEPELDALALWAEGLALVSVGQTAEAIDSCTRALALTTDPTNRVQARSMRGLAHGFRGEHADALRDAEAAVAIARDLGPVPLSGALMLEAQARQFAGELDRAADLQAEAERVGTPVDADFLWRRHTVYGDHALLSGRPADSFEHYARSLEAAEEHDNQMQVLFDLLGVATALATLEDDAQALEVTAMATALMSELGGPGAVAAHLLGQDTIAAARERLGPVATAAAEQRGRTVPVAQRVSRACELARAYAPAGAW